MECLKAFVSDFRLCCATSFLTSDCMISKRDCGFNQASLRKRVLRTPARLLRGRYIAHKVLQSCLEHMLGRLPRRSRSGGRGFGRKCGLRGETSSTSPELVSLVSREVLRSCRRMRPEISSFLESKHIEPIPFLLYTISNYALLPFSQNLPTPASTPMGGQRN